MVRSWKAGSVAAAVVGAGAAGLLHGLRDPSPRWWGRPSPPSQMAVAVVGEVRQDREGRRQFARWARRGPARSRGAAARVDAAMRGEKRVD
jgi:hypothetical protein